MEISLNFVIIMIVLALFLTAMFTASYNEDKTKGL